MASMPDVQPTYNVTSAKAREEECTTKEDGEAAEDSNILYVAVFEETEWDIITRSRVHGWAVTTKRSERNKGSDFFKVILLPELLRKLEEHKSPILTSPYLSTDSSALENFKKGRFLCSLANPIRPCTGKTRPKVLYRAVHDQHPGNGLESRGFGAVKTDQISFMLHFCYHLNWKCRNASPFMSATVSAAKAVKIASWYASNDFRNVEVLTIRLDDIEGSPQPRVWDILQTATKLHLHNIPKKPDRYYGGDYLIEDFISVSCVTRLQWTKMKAALAVVAEKNRKRRPRKRKRSVFEADGLVQMFTLMSGGT